MIPDRKRTAVEYGIALDLVVIATGAALLLAGTPFAVVTVYLTAVLGGGWFGGRRAGFTAGAFSLLALVLLFDETLGLVHFGAFAAGAVAAALAAPELRRRLAGTRLAIPAFPTVTAAQPREIVRPPRLIVFALPLLVILIYSNVSDVLIRNFGVPSLLQAMILLLSLAVWRYRDTYRPSRVVFQPLTIILGLQCFLLFVSTIWATDVALADKLVVSAVKNFFLYAIVAILALNWRAVHRALGTLVITAAILSLIAIAQTTTKQTFGELGGLASVKHGSITGTNFDIRASGPVEDPNFYAQILVIVAPLGAFLAYSAKTLLQRAFWGGATLIVLAGTLMTYSRGAMLALGLMAAALAIMLRLSIRHMAALAAAGVVVLLLLPANVSERFMTFAELLPGQRSAQTVVDSDGSFELRKLYLLAGAAMFEDHPLLGVGPGNYGAHFPYYANRIGLSTPEYELLSDRRYTHMLYMELGAENGLVGLALFVAGVWAAYVALRTAQRALAEGGDRQHAALAMGLALAIVGYLITSVFLHGSLMRYLWLLYAFAAATYSLAARTAPQEAPA